MPGSGGPFGRCVFSSAVKLVWAVRARGAGVHESAWPCATPLEAQCPPTTKGSQEREALAQETAYSGNIILSAYVTASYNATLMIIV
eukprot:359140-Chlamydomonas_euryale.AAC.5